MQNENIGAFVVRWLHWAFNDLFKWDMGNKKKIQQESSKEGRIDVALSSTWSLPSHFNNTKSQWRQQSLIPRHAGFFGGGRMPSQYYGFFSARDWVLPKKESTVYSEYPEPHDNHVHISTQQKSTTRRHRSVNACEGVFGNSIPYTLIGTSTSPKHFPNPKTNSIQRWGHGTQAKQSYLKRIERVERDAAIPGEMPKTHLPNLWRTRGKETLEVFCRYIGLCEQSVQSLADIQPALQFSTEGHHQYIADFSDADRRSCSSRFPYFDPI